MPADISQLAADLNHPDPATRCKAAEQLSRLGSDAREAALPLVRACAAEAEEIRQWAAAALEELGPPSASDLDALALLLADENADVGYWAATLLGRSIRAPRRCLPWRPPYRVPRTSVCDNAPPGRWARWARRRSLPSTPSSKRPPRTIPGWHGLPSGQLTGSAASPDYS